MANNDTKYIISGKNLHLEGSWDVDFEPLTRTGSKWHPFKGELVSLCMPAIRQLTRNKSKGTCSGLKSSLKSIMDFIDIIDAASLEGVSRSSLPKACFDWVNIEKIWPTYISYMRIKDITDSAKYLLTTGLCRIFRAAHDATRPPGAHPTELRIEPHFYNSKTNSYSGDEISLEDASVVFRALGRLFVASLSRIEKCTTLLAEGSDPRKKRGGWAVFPNRLWAVRNLRPHHGDGNPKLAETIRDRMRAYPIPDEHRINAIDEEKRFYKQKYFGCLEFTRVEISIALALVAYKTGFNPDALARMNIDDWKRQSLVDADTQIVIQAKKRGGSYYLTASSSKHKRLDPYRVIREVIRKQQDIRDELAREAETNGDPHLAARAKLIWIFRDAHGNIKDLSNETVGGGGLSREAALISSILERLEIRDGGGHFFKLDFSTARDIWALFTYRKSNGNLLLTARALGHKSITSLLYYLEKKELLIEDRKRLVNLQDKIFTDIMEERLDALELRARLQALPISSKGFKCADPRNPTAEGDPGHKEGSVCIAQNCLSCAQWIADARSVPHLIRMERDLELIRETTTGAAWLASTYRVDLAMIGHILSKFSAKLIEESRAKSAILSPIIPLSSVGLGRK